MKRTSFVAIQIIGLAAIVSLGAGLDHSYKPKNGYVPDEKIAIRVAVAVWIPIYGEKQIEKEKPYHAVLTNGVWSVEGSLPTNTFGGVAIAEVAKDDARVLRVSHGK
jgi:hypothetical protein